MGARPVTETARKQPLSPGADKRCSRCGGEFDCGAGRSSCWCVSERVPKAVLDRLRAKYPDCLCPSCLREVAAGGNL
ncbi:MAG: cysteine-rich CWC family protein [Planctomycetes bacterium]|nr:cysteine-rich CWC family protein [Planctomycetota bacterium]